MYTPVDAEADALSAAAVARDALATAQAQRDATRARLGTLGPGTEDRPPQTPTPSEPGNSISGHATVYQWLVAWVVVILFGILIARTRIGYTLIYYALALTLMFLLLSNYRWVTAAVAPITNSKDLLQ